MEIGIFTVILRDLKFEKALDYVAALGVKAVEIGTGAYPGADHCHPDELLRSSRRRQDFLRAIDSRGLQISSLSVHGNPVHPERKIAAEHDRAFRKTVRLAQKLGVEVVTTFSGCPGGSPKDKTPNWATCAWPSDYQEILDYQWNKIVIPYWKRTLDFTRGHGVKKIALEMHPGFVVYNPETLLRLRRWAGLEIGVNFDPSHLFWQGIDPCAALLALRHCVWHMHAKDTSVHQINTGVNGVLDTKPYRDELNRSWIFRTVGYGHSRQFWCDLISTLRMIGYDGALSIEHEDSLMTSQEGLEKSVRFLDEIILHEVKGKVVWA